MDHGMTVDVVLDVVLVAFVLMMLIAVVMAHVVWPKEAFWADRQMLGLRDKPSVRSRNVHRR